jgi:hypothetical protein
MKYSSLGIAIGASFCLSAGCPGPLVLFAVVGSIILAFLTNSK